MQGTLLWIRLRARGRVSGQVFLIFLAQYVAVHLVLIVSFS